MATSLVMMGEMGLHDYLIAITGKLTDAEIRTFVPHIIGAIRSALTVSRVKLNTFSDKN